MILLSVKGSTVTIDTVLASIAIVVSFFTLYIEQKSNKRINEINLDSHFFTEIYDGYLIKKIPKARMDICNKNGTIQGVEKLVDELNNIRLDSVFYKYKDPVFFKEVAEALQNLEDYLAESINKTYDNIKYESFLEELNAKILKIYQVITSNYIGNKKKKNGLPFFYNLKK